MQNSITIVVSGEAGQGLQTMESLLVEAISTRYHVFSTSEVMSRVRGGNNTFSLRIAGERIFAYRSEIDYLFLLNDHALGRLSKRITPSTQILDRHNLPMNNGKPRELNAVIMGFVSGMLALDLQVSQAIVGAFFTKKNQEEGDASLKAFDRGFEQGLRFASKPAFLKPHDNTDSKSLDKTYKIADGTQAVGIGALGGGCNFVAAYPMSPGTGLLAFMADHGISAGVLVEQAEDEIAALNMVIGAWYAGARGLTTTSGGGFSLMQEAVSLAGMTETPCVIHVGQRPGPATGMPTRTEQADLNLVVYAGHGEFPRIVLAPGSLEDGVILGQKAFYLADKYQVPVFILTDQFYLESKGQMTRLTLSGDFLKQHIIKTELDYRRYRLNESGISPRGIPGFGQGLVKVDSDEHDEYGMITEDFDLRIAMNDKRLGKEALILAEYENPELIGPENYEHLLIGWGSTYGVCREYIMTAAKPDTAFLHLKQVYPLSPGLKPYFDRAKSVTVIEGNATGQLADLLRLRLNVLVTNRILKYNGEPFSIEEIEKQLGEVL